MKISLELKKLNQEFYESGKGIIPINFMDLPDYSMSQHGKNITFFKGDNIVTFKGMKGSGLSEYLENDNIKEKIMQLFSKMSDIEAKHTDLSNLKDLDQKYRECSEQLPDLYSKLGQEYWLIESASSTNAAKCVLASIDREINKIKNKPRI